VVVHASIITDRNACRAGAEDFQRGVVERPTPDRSLFVSRGDFVGCLGACDRARDGSGWSGVACCRVRE
jgi:hypothetical protein